MRQLWKLFAAPAVVAVTLSCGGSTDANGPDNRVSFTYSGAVSGSFSASGIDATGASVENLLAGPTMSTVWNTTFPYVTIVVTRPTSRRRIDMLRVFFPRNTGVFEVSTKAVQMFLYLGVPVDSSSLSVAVRPDSSFFITTGNSLGASVSGQMTVSQLVFDGQTLKEFSATFAGSGPRSTDGHNVTISGSFVIHSAPPGTISGELCALLGC